MISSPFAKTHPTGTSQHSYAFSASSSAFRMSFCSDSVNEDVGRMRGAFEEGEEAMNVVLVALMVSLPLVALSSSKRGHLLR